MFKYILAYFGLGLQKDIDMINSRNFLFRKIFGSRWPVLLNMNESAVYTLDLIDDRDVWENLFNQCSFANLLQAWHYGDAKSESEKWTVKRCIIKKNDIPIALCQFLEKPIWLIGKIIRINRGPVWCGHPDYSEKFFIYRLIGKSFGIFSRSILSIAPSLNSTPENLSLLKMLGYKRRKKMISWKSALIDLQKNEAELWAALRSRLRNYLKHAIAKEFFFEMTANQENFKIILDRYIAMRNERDFTGVSPRLIELLYNADRDHNAVLIAIVRDHDDTILAEKLLVLHGNQCTPLVAWTSQEGAKCHAMHYAIWNVLLYLKNHGVSYYDVGGYQDTDGPSVTQFKQGFGGDEHCLVGEYYKFF